MLCRPRPAATCVAAIALSLPALAGDDPWADAVAGYAPGANPTAGFTDAAVSLGPPERITGETLGYPGVVSPFNPPFGAEEIVSVGAGGYLIVEFDPPITDDPGNPFGIDLLIFGNAFFVDTVFPDGIVGGVFGAGGEVDVSFNGVDDWETVPGAPAISVHPTAGYRDALPYDTEAGRVPTDFTRPVDPALTLAAMMGLGEMQVRTAYAGSGGGTGIDLAATTLDTVRFVRVRTPGGAAEPIEIDAFADVRPLVEGDTNGDDVVNVNDLVAVISDWGPSGPLTTADVNHDLVVDVNDLVTVIQEWTP